MSQDPREMPKRGLRHNICTDVSGESYDALRSYALALAGKAELSEAHKADAAMFKAETLKQHQCAEQAEKRAQEVERDAQRYRFLKLKIDTLENRLHFCAYMNWHPKELDAGLDASIDAAMSAK